MPKPACVALVLIASCCQIFAADSKPSEQSIRQLIDVTEARRVFDGVGGQCDSMMRQSVQQALKGRKITPAEQKIIDTMRAKTVKILEQDMTWDRFEPFCIQVYRDHFTQEEIDGMLAFYRTPVGRAVIKKMPIVMQCTMAEIQKWVVPFSQKMQVIEREATEELKSLQDQSHGQ